MILDFLISTVFTVLKAFFGLLPDFPDMPSEIEAMGDTFFGYVSQFIGVVIVFTGAPLFAFGLVVMTVLLLFEPLYKAFHWLLRKLPLPVS